ncbi:MAG: zinc metallopeptidase [Nitrospirales bacterium]
MTRKHFNGKSLTALTIAAHEGGHAIQDQVGFQALAERTGSCDRTRGRKNRSGRDDGHSNRHGISSVGAGGVF